MYLMLRPYVQQLLTQKWQYSRDPFSWRRPQHLRASTTYGTHYPNQ